MVKSSSKLKSHRGSGSRRMQQYGGGSTNLVELMKSTIHKVNRTQITGLKAKQEALKSNEEFWSERQDWDGEGFGDSIDGDMERVADVLEGWTAMDHSNAGDWEDITGDFWRTEMGKSLVRNGLFPCSPGIATVGITTRTLEIFRLQSLRCPRLSIKAFVKSLCDIQGVPFKPYLQVQFSIAFDVYLNVLGHVHGRVQAALGRNSSNWRLANACPCCLYHVEGEPELQFRLLGTWDGGNSLKRLRRNERAEAFDQTDPPQLAKSKEYTDTRDAGGDYYLSREEVNQWSKEAIKEMSEGKAEDSEPNPCAERWKNLSEELTAKMWGVYDETGVFLSLCRHSFVLLIVDMVASGELAKYPLAILNRLFEVIGEGIGMGYDIGCAFGTTVANSPLGEKAKHLRFTSLVGAFHGHAHSRLCQTSHLCTYINGLGIEHLEQCKTFFSESNELASSVHHMSVFHRRQAIARYCYHHDNLEAYSRLSKLLVDNYKQAVDIQATLPALAKTMSDLGIPSVDTFNQWLKEEKDYLSGLKKEPAEETVQMEYYKKLVKLEDAELKLIAATREWVSYTPGNISQAFGRADQTRRIETQRQHAIENRNDLKKEVQMLEVQLGVKDRWTSGSEDWEKAKKMVAMAKYQRALDKLEGLVVARLFELTKLNMSCTGYKLRTHIANALKARSQAIRTAVTTYNDAAAELGRPQLTWDQVIEYSFLSDFDLLRDARRDVRSELWSQPAGRLALDQYYKLLRAPEEILRLNKEIRSFITYIHEETAYIRLKAEEIRQTDPLLSIQIIKHGWERGRCNEMHLIRLRKLEKMPGFTGSLTPGRGALYPLVQAAMEADMQSQSSTFNDRDADEDAPPPDEDPDEEDNALAELIAVMQVSSD
ncbi:hypothetical protein DFH05DRAFT_1610652 [Lentinula detonsa]|uniref:CxC1-like cysteine cluster associated with KDZ transposases domain-containing protein n=1 Tax=Lentinula detonsa TaxID=2804962 RepID=A0A9W8P2M8_9AGAR|nr:hypothetical protein DFH05DRAFT_1610652 [Lentinula detonsa]